MHNRISRFTANGDVAVRRQRSGDLRPRQPERRDEPQRRRARLRPRRQAVRGGRRERQRRERAVDVHRARQDAPPQRRRLDSRPTTRSTATTSGKNRAIWALGLRNPVHVRASIRWAPSCSSTTWARTRGRRSTRAAPAPTTAGPRRRGRRAIRGTSARGTPTTTASGCAITGGAFYAPQTAQFPGDYVNDYFFADYCGGWIRKLDPSPATPSRASRRGLPTPVDLKVSDDGSLYYLARGSGSTTGVVMRIIRATSSPTITTHPAIGDRSAGDVGHLQRGRLRARRRCGISGSATAARCRRRDREDVHDRRESRATRRAVPGQWSATISGTCSATRPC